MAVNDEYNIESGQEEQLNILENSVFEVSSVDDIAFYVAGILDVSETIFEKGIESLREDKSFEILSDIFMILFEYIKMHNITAFTFMVEENYVDRVYRDSYYIYFSGKHFCYDRFCKRIFLFANTFDKPILDIKSEELNKHFVGSIVVRPIPKRAVGRTLLNPRYFMGDEPCFIREVKYDMVAFGKRVSVKAFPYSMQDGETTTCAEITILNLMDYYSRSYPEYHYLLPSDINRAAKENGYERSLPTHGLKYEMISKEFFENGFYPRLYSSEKMSKDKFRRLLYYYIESGIPLSLGVSTGTQNKHSIIVIGHGRINADSNKLKENLHACYDIKSDNIVWVCDAADVVDEFCIMDDTRVPYTLMKCTLNEQKQLKIGEYIIESMMVPLYKKMYLEASDASEIFKVILASKEFGLQNADLDVLKELELFDKKGECLGTMKTPIVVRMFMASSRSLRKCRDEQFEDGNEEVRAWYSTTLFPKFVWVCELSIVDTYSKNVIGEIILDATSSADAYADGLIIVHYPKRIFCRLPQDVKNNENAGYEDTFIHEIDKWKAFAPYNSNLYSTGDE